MGSFDKKARPFQFVLDILFRTIWVRRDRPAIGQSEPVHYVRDMGRKLICNCSLSPVQQFDPSRAAVSLACDEDRWTHDVSAISSTYGGRRHDHGAICDVRSFAVGRSCGRARGYFSNRLPDR